MATTTKATELSQLSSALQVDESTGEIIFTGSLSVDSNTLFVDGDANRVGIGTLTPGSALDVSGDVTVSGNVDGRDVSSDGSKLDTIESNADVTDTANVTAAGALMDSELTNESAVKNIDQELTTTSSVDFGGLDVDSGTLFVDSANGRVGIGTSSPNAQFSLFQGNSSKSLDFETNIISLPTASVAPLIFTTDGNGTGFFDNFGGLGISARIEDTASSKIALFTSLKERLNVDNNGNIFFYEDTGTTPKFFWDASAERLGIGTSSPEADLHVSGDDDFRLGGANSQGRLDIRTFAGGAGAARVSYNAVDGTGTGDPSHLFQINGSEAARIDSNGNVGIGTSSPDEALDVNGTANATNLTRDGSQVYSRDNILGTVSESGGVPTGAIIESGSNSNGEFVKYADGTQICRGDLGLGTQANSEDTGFESLAANFNSTAYSLEVTVYPSGSTFDTKIRNARSNYGRKRTDEFFYWWEYTTGSTNSLKLSYVAIGRWY